jgi:hypothetical protein
MLLLRELQIVTIQILHLPRPLSLVLPYPLGVFSVSIAILFFLYGLWHFPEADFPTLPNPALSPLRCVLASQYRLLRSLAIKTMS